MSIKVACPRCAREYHLADAMRGKTVRCRECDDTFAVPDEAEESSAGGLLTADDAHDRPRRRAPVEPVRRRERDEEERPRRREQDEERRSRPKRPAQGGDGLVIGLLIGGAVLLVLLVFGGIALAFFLAGSGNPAPVGVPPVASNFPVPPNPGNVGGLRGMPPAGADWNKLRIGMTEQEVVAMFGPPAHSWDYEGIHVIHANVTPDEVRGPDGKTRPVRKLHYFKGMGQMGFVDVTLVDGKVFKVKK
jgi:hypothetical protein